MFARLWSFLAGTQYHCVLGSRLLPFSNRSFLNLYSGAVLRTVSEVKTYLVPSVPP